MARARRVQNIHPKETMRVNAQRVLATRVDELLSWREALSDPALIAELHDMRIAAKRLRYALEMFDVCFAEAKELARTVGGIQEDLGTIHDLDVLIDQLRARLHATVPMTEERATEIMASEGTIGEKQRALRRLLSSEARDPRRLGLFGLIGDKTAERRRRYAKFQRQWGGGKLAELSIRIQTATGILADGAAADQADAAATAAS